MTNLRLTDSSNAERLIEMYGNELRYCPQTREWLIWDGRRWAEDIGNQIYTMAKDVARSYETTAEGLNNKEGKLYESVIRHARSSESLRGIQSMIHLAQSHEDVVVSHEDFDRNPDRLCVANGVIDLTDCSLHKFDPSDNITKLAPVVYTRGKVSKTWDRFMSDVVPDLDTRDFVQRAVGYSITGHMYEERMFLLYGQGQNGKTTFTSTILNLLGDYAAQASSSALMRSSSRGPNNELYVLIGRRFISASETGESGKLNETLIKQMTGMDRVSVNPKYKSQMEFYPSWKIWLSTNHEPMIVGDDKAIWRRIIKIPFTVVIDKPDPKLKLRLLNDLGERSGILNWILEGVKMWRERRLELPDQVSQVTNIYQEEQSITGQFMKEICKCVKGVGISKSRLYNEYVKFCKSIREKPKSKNAFGRQIHEMGMGDSRDKNDRYWVGICTNKAVSLNPLDFEN